MTAFVMVLVVIVVRFKCLICGEGGAEGDGGTSGVCVGGVGGGVCRPEKNH